MKRGIRRVAWRVLRWHSPQASSRLEQRSRSERFTDWLLAHAPFWLVRLAVRLVARPAPLRPEPGWHFDWKHADRDSLTVFRRGLWNFFHEHGLARPVTIRWYDRLRVRIYLGNDLSKCLFVNRSYDPNEFVLLREFLRPGMTYIDAGANEGLYTLFAARRVGRNGRVVAIEPSPRERERLRENVRTNRLRNVELCDFALSDKGGDAILAIAGYGHEGQNTLGDRVSNPLVQTEHHERVQLTTLDRLVSELELKRVDAVKLDVEGSEVQVMRGGAETIARFRPVIQLEVEEHALALQGNTRAELVDTIDSLGYEVFVFDARTAALRPPVDESELRSNVIAAPRGWRPPIVEHP